MRDERVQFSPRLFVIFVNFLQDVRLLLAGEVVDSNSIDAPGSVDHESLLKRIESFLAGNHSNSLATNQRLALCSFFYLLVAVLGNRKQFTLKPFAVTVKTDLAISSGLGSSASYAVVLAGTFHTYAKYLSGINECFTLSDYDLKCVSKWAFDIERIMHGTPSGQKIEIARGTRRLTERILRR